MSAIFIRGYEKGDEQRLAFVLDRCFGHMERWTAKRVAELASGPDFDPEDWRLAIDGSRPVGCVRVHRLPRAGSYVIRELAVDADAPDATVDRLITAALDLLGPRKPEHIRASTPEVSPYPEAYGARRFVPVRRALTLDWDLSGTPWTPEKPQSIDIHEAGGYPPELLAELYVEGMRPYWDWHIEERGGATSLKERVARHLARSGPDELWLVAELGGSPVGLTGATALDREAADLEGVYVLPPHRGQGVGAALMAATLAGVRERVGRMVVYETVSSLGSDIPSIRLYRRAGARLQVEYLHLERDGSAIARG